MAFIINFVFFLALSVFGTRYYARKQLNTDFPIEAVVKVSAVASILTIFAGIVLGYLGDFNTKPGDLEIGLLESFFPYLVLLIQVIVFYVSYKYFSQKFLPIPEASQKKFAESVVIFVVVLWSLLSVLFTTVLASMLVNLVSK